ncbi:MAG: branched-chain amino acid ABC transporter permease [Candidatus Humimicrobiaceae bacterium]
MITTILSIAVSAVFLGSIYVLLGVGMSLLYGVSQTINLAHGDLMIIGSYLTFVFVSAVGLAPLWLLIIAPILMGIFGVVLYKTGGFSRILIRPSSRTDREFTTMIMTFALAWIFSNLLAAIFTANFQSYPSLDIQIFASSILPFRKLITIVISLSLLGIIWLIIKKTWIGLAIRCVFDDNEASKLMGVNVDIVHFFIFFIAFFTAGTAGTLYSMNFSMTPYLGTEFTIIAIVVAIIGGIGSVKGALVGGFMVALTETLVLFFVSPLLKIAFVYALFVAILLIRPSGLFKNM